MGVIQRRVRSVFGRRKSALYLPLFASTLVVLALCWRLCGQSSRVLLPRWRDQLAQDLEHFRRSRSLGHYLDSINLLIEPSSQPCINLEEVPVIALVASAPTHHAHRQAIRETWGRHQPTYFLVGLQDEASADDQLIINYMEAKQHDDLVVYDFRDHYQNLTVKTALILQWTLTRCAHAQFVLKVDDDVMVNPWVLGQVLKENEGAKLVGYVHKQRPVYRQKDCKWYLPRWLHSLDVVPQFLTGPAYLINGDYTRKILKAAEKVPMINIEDVYFTHLVASSLGLRLSHDLRLAPKRPWPPWLPLGCAYWHLGIVHSVGPGEMGRIWEKVQVLGRDYGMGRSVCDGFLTKLVLRFVYLY